MKSTVHPSFKPLQGNADAQLPYLMASLSLFLPRPLGSSPLSPNPNVLPGCGETVAGMEECRSKTGWALSSSRVTGGRAGEHISLTLAGRYQCPRLFCGGTRRPEPPHPSGLTRKAPLLLGGLFTQLLPGLLQQQWHL